MSKQEKKLSKSEYAKAIWGIVTLSFKTAPWAISFKLAGVLVDALLPIAITYFAALTTTELASAFNGNPNAGKQALIYIAVTAGLGFFATIWRSADQYIQALVRYQIEAKVSDVMYEHFLSLDFWQYDDKETADLYDRAQKFSQFYAWMFDRLASILSQLVTLLFSIIALSVFLPFMALFVFIAVIPGVFIQFKLSRTQVAHWNTNVGTRRAKSYIEWNLFQPDSIAELRLNGLVRHLLNLRQTYRDKDEKERLEYERKFIGKRLLADGLEAATELGALIWIALQIIAREQPIGQFVYVQQLVSRAIGGANSFVSQLSGIDEDLANLFDYQKFMSLPARQEGTVTLQKPPQAISFTNISFRYPQTKKHVLKNISFTIQQGSHVAIVGENGAGKTTLIKLLTGLYASTKGSITIDNTPLNDITIGSWHQQLSVLQQDFQKYQFADLKDNVVFGDVSHPEDKDSLAQALNSAEASSFIEKLPHKLQTFPNTWMEDDNGNKGISLSGGQWQRVALARNFYRDAPIIILDEPTSAIDALAESRIFNRLFAKSNKKTVVTISHRLSTVEKADYIIVLKDGEIAETGVHSELVAKKGEYYRMFKSQIEKG